MTLEELVSKVKVVGTDIVSIADQWIMDALAWQQSGGGESVQWKQHAAYSWSSCLYRVFSMGPLPAVARMVR